MSKCKVDFNQNRKHVYPPGTNRCVVCQHVTKKGKRFREASKLLNKEGSDER